MHVQVIQDLWVKRYDGKEDIPWLGKGVPRRELVQDFVVELDGVRHTVPRGYVFDGSSVPRFLWAAYPPSFDPAWRGACLHDRGLSHWFRDYPQEYWDQALRAMILHDGGSRLTAWVFYKSVGLAPRGGYKHGNSHAPGY